MDDIEAIEDYMTQWKAVANENKKEPYPTSIQLCIKYLCDYKNNTNCNGCPISKDTGLRFCHGTPLGEWVTHHQIKHENYALLFKVECPECKDIAIKMIDYLENLSIELKKSRIGKEAEKGDE